MAVSPACIAAVVDASGNRMDDAEATELIRYMETMRRAEEARGNLDGLDERLRALAAQQAERARVAAAVRQMHAARSAIKLAARLEDVGRLRDQGFDWRKSVLVMLEGTTRAAEGNRASTAATAIAYQDRFLQAWNRLLMHDDVIARRSRDGDFNQAVVREMREPGSSGDPDAARLAKTFADTAEGIRTDLNRLGAHIGRLDGWSPQLHDSNRVAGVTRDAWIAEILPLLDAERSFPGLTPEQLQATLSRVYDDITTGVSTSRNAADEGRVSPANLASSLSRHRVLHFRDARAWLAYNEKFGGGTIQDAMASHISLSAKFAAQMDHWGPNPDATFTRFLSDVQARASRDPKLTVKERQSQARALGLQGRITGNSAIGSAWAEVTGLTASVGNLRAATIMGNLRGLMSLTRLGGAVVSSITDTGTRALALTYQGRSLIGALSDTFGGLRRGRGMTRAEREVAAVMGAGVEGMRGHIVAAGLAEDVPMGKMHRALAFFFRIQGMTGWQDVMKAGQARALAGWAGVNAEHGWQSLPRRYRNMLRQHGVTAQEWELIRSTAYDADGTRYVTPDRIADLPRAALTPLARRAIDAMADGLADRQAKRQAANAREAGWVRSRTSKMEAATERAVAGLQRLNQSADGARDRRVSLLEERMGELQARLSDLAEFHDALAEGRAWSPATPEADPNADVMAWRPGEALPEDVAAAEARSAELAAQGHTVAIDTPERQAQRASWISEVANARAAEVPGGIALERRALIVIGPPSAGKSTVIEPLARDMRALLVDPDDMKARIPEFEGGVGAGRVHAESSDMAAALRQRAIEAGMNLALPTVGDNAAKLRTTIEGLQAAGYHVTLVLNELPIEKAAQRNMVRFRETGRLVSVEYLLGIGNKPVESYMSLREIADAQAHYSNDVGRGEAPLHRGGLHPLQANQAADAGTAGDVAAGSGPRPDQRGAGEGQRGEEGPGGLASGRPASSNTSLSGAADTGGNRTFSPSAERYLDAGDPATLAARAEGELRGRLDALRRTIGTINRMAGQAEKKRLGAFVTWWNQRDNELAAFISQMEDRAGQRDAAGRAEEAAWQPRVDRALDDARTDLEVKVRRMFADEMRFGYLETDAATRRLTIHGTQPGTFTGELLRSMMQFKAFPVAFTQRVLGRALHGFSREERLTQGAHLGQLIVSTSLLGVLAMTLKDLLAGREPRDLTRPKALLAGLVQGGGLGIFGDFLFAEASRSGNRPLENIAGPLAGTGASLVGLFVDARDGDPKAGRILNQIISAVPGNNLWWAKLGLDLLILNELREQASPGFLARQDRNRQRDFGQGRWAPASIWD